MVPPYAGFYVNMLQDSTGNHCLTRTVYFTTVGYLYIIPYHKPVGWSDEGTPTLTPDHKMLGFVPYQPTSSGTVTVVSGKRFCITTWLPRCRTSRNPWRVRMVQTWLPEITRSLPNGNLQSGHIHFLMQARLNLLGRGRFEK